MDGLFTLAFQVMLFSPALSHWDNFMRRGRATKSFLRSTLCFVIVALMRAQGMTRELQRRLWAAAARKMGLLSVDLLITLQILPIFFSNCLFLALYDSVVLLKHMVLLLSRSKTAHGEWRRMLTSEGLRCVWNSFLLDAYKQVCWWVCRVELGAVEIRA